MVGNGGPGASLPPVQILVLPLSGYGPLDELLNLPLPQVPCLSKWTINIVSSVGPCED